MAKSKSGKLELRLEDQKNGEYEDHVYFPLYLNSYEDALRSIFLQLLWNEDCEDNSKKGFSYVNRDRESNILSFIGARGSGKSTAMTEFSQIVDKLNRDSERIWWIEKIFVEPSLKNRLLEKKFFFKVLEPIDVSCLEEKEDLFEMVMAALFREYEQEVEKMQYADHKHYNNREIQELFNEIIDGYYAIKNSREESFGDSYIARLRYMSTSMDINKKIKRLVDCLLQMFFYNGQHSCYRFIVISLDDLDLNIHHGYEMLEQIKKYFFQTNIIVTLSGDYDQLNRICTYHYVKGFSGGKSHVIEDKVFYECQKLALDYIAKVLPVNARVFMPSLETMTRNVVVGEDAVRVKHYIMAKVAETMQIYYDIRGLKTHFSEPRTVRELVSYNQFLESLWDIPYESWNPDELEEEQQLVWMNHYDQNHERFNQDILGRQLNIFLNEEDKRKFNEWSKQNLERRAVNLCDMMFRDVSRDKKMSREFAIKDYSYADLLEGIYKYGRVSDYRKQYIKCVLAILSSEMVREKNSLLKNPSEDSRKRSMVRMNKFLGKSFGNEWLGNMVPFISLRRKLSFGFQAEAEFSRIHLKFPIPFWWEFFIKNEKEWKLERKNKFQKCMDEFLNWLKENKMIQTLECMAMFFEPIDSPQQKIRFRMRVGMDESSITGDEYFIIEGENVICSLDIFGFIKRTLDYENNSKENLEGLADSLSEMWERYLLNNDEIKKELSNESSEENKRINVKDTLKVKFLEEITKLSIHSQYPWKNTEGAAFPFYDLDLSYNVMKRARNELLESNPLSIKEYNEYYTYIVKVYQKIISLLKEEERDYKAQGIAFHYAENFAGCPFIKAFLNAKKDLHPDFVEDLGGVIYNTISPTSLIKEYYLEEE